MSQQSQTPRDLRSVTRAGSRARSEEPTVPAQSPTKRGRGVAGSRVRAVARDNDESTPPVLNKPSTAYGAAGKIGAPTHMDANSGFRDSGSVMQKAVQQGQGSESLAPVTEELDDEDAQSMASSQLQGEAESAAEAGGSKAKSAAQASPWGIGGTPGNGTATSDRSWILDTFWAPRGTLPPFRYHWSDPNDAWFDTLPWYWQLYGYIIYLANPLTYLRLCFNYFVPPLNFIVNVVVDNLAVVKVLAVIFFVLLVTTDFLAGPLLPAKYDLPGLKALRPHTGNWNAPPSCPDNAELKDLFAKYQLGGMNNRVSELEQKCFAKLDEKTKIQIKPQINWFEPGQGARVLPYISSPTLTRPPPTWFRSIMAFFFIQPALHVPVAGSHIEAISDWRDGGLDRWCAPPSRGKLQLTVITAREIIPTELIVENISMDRSIMNGMAPREVELWIEIKDEETLENVHLEILRRHAFLFQRSSPQPKKELDPRINLGHYWLPIGRWEYNLWRKEEVQRFKVEVDLGLFGVKANKFAVRVNSNWGSQDATCVNRFRLHGLDVSGREEPLDTVW